MVAPTRNASITSGLWFALVGTGVSILTATVLWKQPIQTPSDPIPEIKIPKRRPPVPGPPRPLSSQSSRRVSVDDLFSQSREDPIDALVALLELCAKTTRALQSLVSNGENVVLLNELAFVTTSTCRLQHALQNDEISIDKSSSKSTCFEAATSALTRSLKQLEDTLQSTAPADAQPSLASIMQCLQDQRPAMEFLLQRDTYIASRPPTPPSEAELEHARNVSARSSSILQPRIDSGTWQEPPPQYSPPESTCSHKIPRDTKIRLSFPPELGLLAHASTSHGRDLYDAVTSNDVSAVLTMLEKGFLNVHTSFGDLERTPLHQAAQLNHIQCVTLLIQNGADMTTEDAKGDTPLHLAAWAGHCESLSVLLSHGADINYLSGRDCLTALHCAVNSRSTAAVSLLIKLGADVTIRDASDGLTALHQAASLGQSEICEVLLQQTRQTPIEVVNAVDDDNQTPLHYACAAGSDACVTVLLQQGARSDVHERSNGLTPLHIAAYAGSTSIVNLLLNQGANINAVATGGATPLHLAASKGRTDAIRLLLAQRSVDRKMRAAWNGVEGTPAQFAKERGFSKLAKMIDSRSRN